MSLQNTPGAHVAMNEVGDETIGALLARRARVHPDETYCTFKGECITFRLLDRRVNQMATLLKAQGLARGDRVAVMLPGHPEHLYLIFALARLGMVRVPINVHLIGAPLEHLLTELDPKVLVADGAYRAALDGLAARLPPILWRNGADGEFDAFATCVEDDAATDVRADDIIALSPSSGTTGAPKGVLKTDRHLRAGPLAVLRLTEARPGDVFLFWEALHHGSGVAVAIAALIGRFQLAMLERFSASRFWDDARQHKATHIHYLGSVLPMLLKQPESTQDRQHGVRIAWGGGCPSHIWQEFSERFGVTMREGYGLSELITFVTANVDGTPGSIGKPLSYYDIALLDDNGAPVAAGDKGEVAVRAHDARLGFLGYFRNPQAEADARRGELFMTGDLAHADAQGNLFYAGRKKDMLRRRGINIAAWDVESVFAEHEAIAEVALVGVPSDLGEDELKLFVRVREGVQIEPLELIRWSSSRLPYFQIPRYIEFIESFPKTPTQRIQKKELSRQVAGVWDVADTDFRPAKR
ncbi:AMP-binding protein [Variovorax ginsengisoli]|uniref:Crotonobetaine/carnitine-CoA ligase n=1 Tax=Variovorax ginsengisoli TaxID=363844 RepID=A0ABT9SEQ2_9BURK|nr:AMP-binding protein [Variovorax ginsengisoli]MDP9902835.1 crotonobetaine/carnitine-CoA ligase [Variovorax ginsengisoli]